MTRSAALYPKLSVGGYLIIDDYGAPKLADACRKAITDYRDANCITEFNLASTRAGGISFHVRM